MKTPVLETERLILRPMTAEDAPSAFSNWTSDEDVARFMRWEKHNKIEETIAWLEAEEAMLGSDDVWNWGIVWKESGALIGSVGLVMNEAEGLYELGYNVMKAHWGQGIATEAARRVMEFFRAELGQMTLFCCHAKDNPASGRVIEKLGFVYRGDGAYFSRDGKKRFEAREYLLNVE